MTTYLKGDPGFFKGVGRGWYLGVVESMGHVSNMLQFENWNVIDNRLLSRLQNIIRRLCLHFFQSIYNLVQLFCFLIPRGEWLVTQSIPIP